MTDTMTRQHTLTSIAREAEVTKRTAQRWLTKSGDIGETVEGTRYFSDKERELLLSHKSSGSTANKGLQTSEPVEAEADIQPVIHTGNHREVITAEIVPQQFDLAQFRTQTSTAINLDQVSNAVLALRAVRQGMRQDIENQYQQLEQTQQAEQLLSDELSQLERDADKYAVASDILARLQTQSTKGYQANLKKLSQLGLSEVSPQQ